MGLEKKWVSVVKIASPSLAPWRYTDETEIKCSKDFLLHDDKVVGTELRKAESDSASVAISLKMKNLKEMGAKEWFYASLDNLIEYCEEIIDHEEQSGTSKFIPIYKELAANIATGSFEISNLLCYDEEWLIDILFSKNKVEYFLHENENLDEGNLFEGD